MNYDEKIKLLEDEINFLRKREKEKSDLLNNFEKFIETYENVTELSRQELMQRDSIIKAQQLTLDFSGTERKDETCTIEAWEAVTELARNELMEAERRINAMQCTEDYYAEERKQRDREFKALEKAMNLSRNEMMTYENILNAYRKIQILSDVEKLHILKILNKKVHFDYNELKKKYDDSL